LTLKTNLKKRYSSFYLNASRISADDLEKAILYVIGLASGKALLSFPFLLSALPKSAIDTLGQKYNMKLSDVELSPDEEEWREIDTVLTIAGKEHIVQPPPGIKVLAIYPSPASIVAKMIPENIFLCDFIDGGLQKIGKIDRNRDGKIMARIKGFPSPVLLPDNWENGQSASTKKETIAFIGKIRKHAGNTKRLNDFLMLFPLPGYFTQEDAVLAILDNIILRMGESILSSWRMDKKIAKRFYMANKFSDHTRTAIFVNLQKIHAMRILKRYFELNKKQIAFGETDFIGKTVVAETMVLLKKIDPTVYSKFHHAFNPPKVPLSPSL